MTDPTTTASTAPNFRGNYPMGGERLAPAWQAAWDVLRDGKHHTVTDLVTVMAVGSKPLNERTRFNLLAAARQAELLDVRYRVYGTPLRRRVYSYKIKAASS